MRTGPERTSYGHHGNLASRDELAWGIVIQRTFQRVGHLGIRHLSPDTQVPVKKHTYVCGRVILSENTGGRCRSASCALLCYLEFCTFSFLSSLFSLFKFIGQVTFTVSLPWKLPFFSQWRKNSPALICPGDTSFFLEVVHILLYCMR